MAHFLVHKKGPRHNTPAAPMSRDIAQAYHEALTGRQRGCKP